jgi:hypothetical protein
MHGSPDVLLFFNILNVSRRKKSRVTDGIINRFLPQPRRGYSSHQQSSEFYLTERYKERREKSGSDLSRLVFRAYFVVA